MNLEDAVEECDKLREELEGVGLSDGLVKCIELAYMLGAASVTNPLCNLNKKEDES